MRGLRVGVHRPVTDELIHDFRNFGEDVFRKLRDVCSVNIHEIDNSENTFAVSDIRPGDLAAVTGTITNLARKYGFDGSLVLSALDSGAPDGT